MTKRQRLPALYLPTRDYCAVWAAGALLVGNGPVLTAAGQRLLDLRVTPTGELLLTLTAYDRAGRRLAIVSGNDWLVGDLHRWHIYSGEHFLRLRLPQEQVAVEVDARSEPVMLRASLWHSGHLIDLRPSGVWLDGGEMHRPGKVASAGMALAVQPGSSRLTLEPYQDGGSVFGDPNPLQRYSDAVLAWRRLAERMQPGPPRRVMPV